MVASIREYESPFASIRMTRARRASSDRILRLRTRRSNSARSSVVNVSAIWRHSVPVLLQSVQGTSVVSQRFVKQVSAFGRTRLQGGHADATGPTVDAIHLDC